MLRYGEGFTSRLIAHTQIEKKNTINQVCIKILGNAEYII